MIQIDLEGMAEGPVVFPVLSGTPGGWATIELTGEVVLKGRKHYIRAEYTMWVNTAASRRDPKWEFSQLMDCECYDDEEPSREGVEAVLTHFYSVQASVKSVFEAEAVALLSCLDIAKERVKSLIQSLKEAEDDVKKHS